MDKGTASRAGGAYGIDPGYAAGLVNLHLDLDFYF
jgi:hypothetical protein